MPPNDKIRNHIVAKPINGSIIIYRQCQDELEYFKNYTVESTVWALRVHPWKIFSVQRALPFSKIKE